jgi:hypothetical protein
MSEAELAYLFKELHAAKSVNAKAWFYDLPWGGF